MSRDRPVLRIRWMTVVAGTVLATGLIGCASQQPGAARLDSSASPSASPSPTISCPRVDTIPDDQRDCAVYDPEAAMAENERYREQLPIDSATQEELDGYLEPGRAALEGLGVPASVDEVVQALATVGLDPRSIQTIGGGGTGIGFGAAAEGGCVTGSVAVDGTVEIAAGGYIMDGGCLAMTGH